MAKRNPSGSHYRTRPLVRPLVSALKAYVPGEQPKIKGLIKLNTNENPYPPSPKVLRAVQQAIDDRLRLYPNPTAEPLRQALAKFHQCTSDNVIVGNGSDELLAMSTRAFVEPGKGKSENKVQFFVPSYSLYPVLADIHGAEKAPVALRSDFSIPELEQSEWDFEAPLSLITTPNAPSGRGYSIRELQRLCQAQQGVVVLDEAYVDFSTHDAMVLARKLPNVLVARTFSKGYSLCFLRVGYMIGPKPLIAALDKIRDSYNVNGLAQVAALATLKHRNYYQGNFRRIIKTRQQLAGALVTSGFKVFPSETNFLLVKPPGFSAERWLHELRKQKILARWFHAPEVRDCLRITVGTEEQMASLLRTIEKILKLL